MDRLIKVVKKLRSEEGCPWDKEQTHETLKPYLIEEVYEVIDAIDKKDTAALADELGDLLLQIILHAQIASESGDFDINKVASNISEKMIRRHPHVFEDIKVKDVKDVWHNWEKIKQGEEKNKDQKSILDSIPQGLPALYRASKMQKKAARLGFDWPDSRGPWDKVKEEIAEFDEDVKEQREKKKIIEEFGDIIFSLVNVARKIDIDAEDALRQASKKFEERFKYVEKKVNDSGKEFKDYTLDELDKYWDEAKNKRQACN